MVLKDKYSASEKEPSPMCSSHSQNPSCARQVLTVLSNYLQLFPSLCWELHSKPHKSGSLSALNISSCSNHLSHLHFLLVTLVACNIITLVKARLNLSFSVACHNLFFHYLLLLKEMCSISCHQEIFLVSTVRKNSLVAPRFIKSYKPKLWKQSWVCQMADVISQTLTRVTMAHSAVSWAALNNVRTKR